MASKVSFATSRATSGTSATTSGASSTLTRESSATTRDNESICEEDYDSLVKCIYCVRMDVEDLKLLRCNHTACAKCLKKQGKRINCPKCQVETDMPKGPDFLPDNFLKESLESSHSCKKCAANNKTVLASHVCAECKGVPLCGPCVKAHRANKATKKHTPMGFNDFSCTNADVPDILKQYNPTEPCDRHTTKLIQYFCTRCRELLCAECCREHIGHQCTELGDVSQEQRIKVNKELDKLRKILADIVFKSGEHKQEMKAIKTESEEVIKKLRGRHREVTAILDDVGKGIVETAEVEYSQQIDAIDAKVQHFENLKVCAADTQSLVEVSNKISSDIGIIKNYDFITSRFEELYRLIGKGETMPTPRKTFSLSACSRDDTIRQIRAAFGSIRSVKSTPRKQHLKEPSPHRIPSLNREQEIGKQVEHMAKFKTESISMTRVANITFDEFQSIGSMDVNDSSEICVTGPMRKGRPRVISLSHLNGEMLPPVSCETILPCDMKAVGMDFYITDRQQNCVVKLNRAGRILKEVKLPNREKGVYFSIGLAANKRGDIYVCCYNSKNIYFCADNSSKFEFFISSKDHEEFCHPVSMCLTATDDLVVCTSNRTSITAFTPEKRIKFIYDQLQTPNGLASDQQGNIYFADKWLDRVGVLSPNGELITYLLTKEKHELTGPTLVSLSGDGEFLAVAHKNNKVAVYKPM